MILLAAPLKKMDRVRQIACYRNIKVSSLLLVRHLFTKKFYKHCLTIQLLGIFIIFIIKRALSETDNVQYNMGK